MSGKDLGKAVSRKFLLNLKLKIVTEFGGARSDCIGDGIRLGCCVWVDFGKFYARFPWGSETIGAENFVTRWFFRICIR